MWVTLSGKGQTVKINTDHITLIYPDDRKVIMACGTHVICTQSEYNTLDRKLFATRKKVAKDDTELHEFINQLHKLLGNTGSIALTGDRRAGIEKLFKEGFTKEEIITAATNIGLSEWMHGKNDRGVNYAKIDYLFRKSDKTTWNINKWQEEKVKKQKPMF